MSIPAPKKMAQLAKEQAEAQRRGLDFSDDAAGQPAKGSSPAQSEDEDEEDDTAKKPAKADEDA